MTPVRTFKKQEKIIVTLLYKKGYIEKKQIPELYWAEFFRTNRTKKGSKKSKNKFHTYFPEIHYCSVDYWGEADEHSIVNEVLDNLLWSNVVEENGPHTKSSFMYKGRVWFIRYLRSLPTVNSDNKIKLAFRRIRD
jgi:hypothetical protein